jgi:hypothetical protein
MVKCLPSKNEALSANLPGSKFTKEAGSDSADSSPKAEP